MKKRLLLIATTLAVLVSCNKENKTKNPCEGLIIDVLSQILVIEIVDSEGDNLIANGTYSGKDIFTERNGFQTKPAIYDASELPSLPEELKNVVIIQLFDSKTEPNVVNIHLNQNEMDVLTMDLEMESEGCSGVFYEILELKYNEEVRSFQDIGNNHYKITVTK